MSRKPDGNEMLSAMIDACNSKYKELLEEDRVYRMRGSFLFNSRKERRLEQNKVGLRKKRITGLRNATRLLCLLQANEDLLVELLKELESRAKADRDRHYGHSSEEPP